MAAPASAQHFWVGFGGIQTKEAVAKTPTGEIRSKIRYIDVMVGSDEQAADAIPHTFTAHLSGSGSGGACTAFTEVTTKVKPAVTVLRFSVTYPEQPPPRKDGPPPSLGGTQVQPPIEYQLKANLTGGAQAQNVFPFTFPGGGNKPSCIKLK
jgi:hypothetical protein